MRGSDEQTSHMFSYVVPEQRVRADHPLRAVRRLTDEVLATLSPRFDRMYSDMGRPSIPPEQLLRALLLQSLYTIRSERLLMEEIDYSILFRWFVGLGMDDEIWSPTTFSKNRDRLLEGDIAAAFFDAVVDQARQAGLLSDEHFTVDGTLIQSHASLKSLKKIEREESEKQDNDKDGRGGGGSAGGGRNPSVDFKGEKRTNATHASTTDPEANLYKKGDGGGAFLCHGAHALTENRHGLVMGVRVEEARGTAEREAALAMLDRAEDRHGVRPFTLGADKGYDAGSFLLELEKRWIEPHVAIKTGKIDPMRDRDDEGVWARSFTRGEQRRAGFKKSQRRRKLVEEFFGWVKTVAGLRRARHVGREKIRQCFELAAAAYNLVRMKRLLAA